MYPCPPPSKIILRSFDCSSSESLISSSPEKMVDDSDSTLSELSGCQVLEDVEDVENLARMQEQSKKCSDLNLKIF